MKLLSLVLAACLLLCLSPALAEGALPIARTAVQWDGMTVAQIEEKLLGNTCGRKPTSCADQLARAVRQASDELRGEA